MKRIRDWMRTRDAALKLELLRKKGGESCVVEETKRTNTLFLATFSGPGLVWRKLASVWGGKVVLRCFK